MTGDRETDPPISNKDLVLVTGATGFAGSHLVDFLLTAGRNVRVLVRETSDLRWVPRERVEMVTSDVRDGDSLHRLVAGVSEVYHFGGLTRARSADEFFRVNCEGTLRLARGWLEANPNAKRFVFISSLAASGPAPSPDKPRREDDPPRPVTPYGESKLAGEAALEKHLASRVQTLIIRPPAVYGQRDDATLTLFKWIRRGLLPLPTPPESRVSLIHVEDLVRGSYELGQRGAQGVFHLSDGEFYSWADVGAVIAAHLGRRVRPVRVPRWIVRLAGEYGELAGRFGGRPPVINRDKVRDILQPSWTCSIEKARNLEYRPCVCLEDGMLRTARWYQDAGWL